MAQRKKKTGIMAGMNPTTAAVVGGAAGFGAAKLAIYAGEKLPAKMDNPPALLQKTNVGTHAAAALGVILTIFGKTPAVQGAGVGMIVTVIPEYVDMITDGGDGNDDAPAERATRRTEMQDIEDVEIVEVEPAADAVQGDATPYFDLMQAIQAGENFELYN